MNSAFGFNALSSLSSGNTNIAVGWAAGGQLTTGSNNIYIGNNGVSNENNTTRIGSVQNRAYFAGIFNSTLGGGMSVLVDSNGQLGTNPSSIRFKQSVRDMEDTSQVLMELRPVAFRYREDVVGEADAKVDQYGLIAEEVAKVAPELVAYDDAGQPYSVRYHVLPAMLLNEVQKQQQLIAAMAARIERLEARPQLAWVEPIR